jgi:hypothetical protein
MKRKSIAIIVCAILLVAVYGIFLLNILEKRSRKMDDDFMFKSLWVEAEVFRSNENRYPESLVELLSTNKDDNNEATKRKQDLQNLIGQTKQNRWHSTYNYEPTTNGFLITVTGPELPPAGWFGKQRKIKKDSSEVKKMFGQIQSHAE